MPIVALCGVMMGLMMGMGLEMARWWFALNLPLSVSLRLMPRLDRRHGRPLSAKNGLPTNQQEPTRDKGKRQG